MLKWLFMICLAAFPCLIQADVAWNYDFQKAEQIACQENKPLFVFFTGSDWCTWCIKLENEVLNTDEFKNQLGDRFVFVKLDFPRGRSSNANAAQNDALMNKYGVSGFPTIIILNEKLEKQGSLGYIRGGPMPFINQVKQFVKN